MRQVSLSAFAGAVHWDAVEFAGILHMGLFVSAICHERREVTLICARTVNALDARAAVPEAAVEPRHHLLRGQGHMTAAGLLRWGLQGLVLRSAGAEAAGVEEHLVAIVFGHLPAVDSAALDLAAARGLAAGQD